MKILFFVISAAVLLAATPKECEDYLRQNQAAIDAKTLQADEARQQLQSFQAAFIALQEQKKAELDKREAELNAKLKELRALKEQVAELRAQIERRHDTTKKENLKKLALSFSKMKDAPAAEILEKMKESDAIEVLSALEAKKIAQILPKMSPERAASLSIKLSKVDEESLIQ